MKQLEFTQNVIPMNMNIGDEIVLALKGTSAVLDVGAMSWVIDYPEDLVEIVDVSLPPGTLVKNFVDNQHHLRIAWYTLTPINVATGVSFGGIKVKLLKKPTFGEKITLSVLDLPEVNWGDFTNCQAIPHVVVGIDAPEQTATATPVDPTGPDPIPVVIDPLPATGTTTTQPEPGEPIVKIDLQANGGTYRVQLDENDGVNVFFIK